MQPFKQSANQSTPGYLGNLNLGAQPKLLSNDRNQEIQNECKKELEDLEKKRESVEAELRDILTNPNMQALELLGQRLKEISLRHTLLSKYMSLPDSEINETTLQDMQVQHTQEQQQKQDCVIF